VVRITLATSTLSEGINLPFATVLVPGLKRYSDNSRMSGREFANLAGRAGRPGIATEGQTLALIPSERPSVLGDYRQIIREILGAGETEASAHSAIARLLRHLAQIAPEEDFDNWLEVTAPLDAPASATIAQLNSLDSLDALIIAALEDSNEVGAEAALRTFWRATFAHYAEADEAELETILLARGQAVVSRIYPDQEQRSRIYRTSLPPRNADVLFQATPVLIAHLETGSDYRNWDRVARLDYVLRAIEILDDVPKFRVPAKVGASAATREDALSWWFRVPSSEPRIPSIAQIAQWHDFLQQEVRYRFTWGLGAALAVATENAASLDEAPVPTAALWIKDLLTWGTLDPVEAYMLARGLSDTRPEAAARAEEYYDAVGDASTDPYDVGLLRQWAAGTLPRRRPPIVATAYEASVVDRMPEEAVDRQFRVIPHLIDGTITWIDPSGATLASSTTSVELPDPRDYDFTLHPRDKVVRANRYV
jgi:hypothetical protein